jgi:hypothetical protein
MKEEYFLTLAALSRVWAFEMNYPLDFNSPQVYKANIRIPESIRKREVAHETETRRLGGASTGR